jgi:hypothetical protein
LREELYGKFSLRKGSGVNRFEHVTATEVRAFDALAARYEPMRYAVATAAAAGVGLTLSGTPEASPTGGNARCPNGTAGAFRSAR